MQITVEAIAEYQYRASISYTSFKVIVKAIACVSDLFVTR